MGEPFHSLGQFAGVRIVETMSAVEIKEDWSGVRSPSRAARRLKMGHRQNIARRAIPAAFCLAGTIYAHPEIYRALSETQDARAGEDKADG